MGGSGWRWSGFSGVLTACRRVTWERRRCKCNTRRQHGIQVCGSLGHHLGGTRLELVDSKWCYFRPAVSQGCRDCKNNDWNAEEVFVLGWMLNAQRNQQLVSYLGLCFWGCSDNDQNTELTVGSGKNNTCNHLSCCALYTQFQCWRSEEEYWSRNPISQPDLPKSDPSGWCRPRQKNRNMSSTQTNDFCVLCGPALLITTLGGSPFPVSAYSLTVMT